MGYYDWGQEWLRKFTGNTWITIQPETKVNVDVYWITDRDTVPKQAATSVGYNIFDFDFLDFDTFTFSTSVSPRPKRVRTKSKKFSFWKLILKNSTIGFTNHILSITLDARIGGQVK
jgi:hypothetical protein